MSNDVGKPLPEMRMRQGEMDGLFAMFAALQEFDGAKTDMRDRLKAIPNGYRDLRLAEATLTRLLARIVETIPAEKKRAIRRHATKHEVQGVLQCPRQSHGRRCNGYQRA